MFGDISHERVSLCHLMMMCVLLAHYPGSNLNASAKIILLARFHRRNILQRLSCLLRYLHTFQDNQNTKSLNMFPVLDSYSM